LPSPYLSRIKLEKELEKRAKAIREKGEKCDKNLKDIDDGLEILGKYMDISDLKKQRDEAQEKYDIKDFDVCLSITESLRKSISEKAIKVFQEEKGKIEKILSTGTIEESAKIRADLEEATNKLSSDFVSSFKILESIKSKISEMVKDVILAKKREILALVKDVEGFEWVNNLIKEVKDEGIDALESLQKIEDDVKGKFKELIEEKLNKAQELIDLATSAHYNIPVDVEKKDEIMSIFNSGNFAYALKLADEYYSSIKESFKLFFKKLWDISDMIIKEGRAMGVNVEKPLEILKSADEYFQNEDFKEAIEHVKKATEEAEKIKLHKVLEIIKIARDKLLEAKDKGIDIAPYLTMIENARNFVKIGKHKKAYDTVTEAIQMVERKMNLYSQLRVEIGDIERMVKELVEENIILEGVDEKIEEIQGVLDEDPERAEKMIDELKRLIKISLRDIANSLYQELYEIISAGKEIKIDFRDISMEMDNITTLIKDENWKDSIIALRDIEEKIYERVYEYLNGKIEELKSYENEDVKRMLQELEKLIEENNIKDAISKYAEIQNIIFALQEEKYRKRMEGIENSIKFLEGLGENTVEIRGYLERAEEALKRRDISTLENYLTQSEEIIERLGKNIAEKAYESAKEAAESAKKVNIDLEKNGIAELLKTIEEDLENKNYQDVVRKSTDIISKIKELKERRELIYALQENLSKSIEKLRSKGIETAELEKILEDSRKKLDDNEFDLSEKLVKEGLNKAIELEMKNVIDGIRSKIEDIGGVMKSFGLSKEYEELTKDFFENLKAKKYEGIEKLGYTTIEKLNKKIEKVLDDYINRIGNMINNLREIGIEVDASALDKAREVFYEGKVRDAFNILRRFEREIKEIYDKEMKLKKIIDDIDTILNLASSMGIDIEKYKERVNEINQVEDLDRKEAMAMKLVLDVKKDIRSKIDNLIKTVENELNRLRRSGGDITTSEAMLTKAKNFLSDSRYKEALYYTLQAMGEIEKFEMQKSTAYGILKRIESKIKMMKNLLPKEIISQYEEARALFLRGKYTESIERSMTIGERLWNIEKIISIIKEKNARIKIYIEQAGKSGLDTKGVLKLLAKAKNELKTLNYDDALKFVEEAYKEAFRLANAAIEKYREDYEKTLKILMVYGLRDDFADELHTIDEALAGGDIDTLKERFETLKMEVNSKIRDRMERMIEEAISKVETIKEGGGEYKELEKKVEELKRLKDEDPIKFIEHYKAISREMDLIMPKLIKSKLDSLADKISKYEGIGLKITDYIEKISEIRMNLENKTYDELLNEIQDLENNFDTYLREYIRNKMEKMREAVAKYDKDKAEEFASKMEKLINAEKYEDALKIVDEAESFIGDYKLKISDFNKKALELKDLIKYGLSLGLNLDPQIKELKNTLASLKDLDAAKEKLEIIEKEIKDMMNSLTPKIEINLEDVKAIDSKYLAKISITNKGDTDALNIMLRIEGALNLERPMPIMKVAKGSKEAIDVYLIPGEGENIRVEVLYHRFDGKEYKEEFNWKYRVKRKGFHIEKNKEKIKCTLCRGTILPGLDILICDKCGAVYHLPCAKRAGKCLKCGNPFNFE